MDEKTRGFIKKYWTDLLISIIPVVIILLIILSLLNIWLEITEGVESILFNIYASISVFGGGCMILLIAIYVEIWSKNITDRYRVKYDEFIKEG